jgi:hypothetical protein
MHMGLDVDTETDTDIEKDTNAFTEMNLDIQRFGYLMLRILIGDLT